MKRTLFILLALLAVAAWADEYSRLGTVRKYIEWPEE